MNIHPGICSICKKYTSVGPIKIYESGKKICGRCNEGVENEVYSLHPIPADQEFPCVNYYEGCRKYFRSDQIKHHESKCIGSLIDCPMCPKYNGITKYTLLMLIDHYNMYHPELILKYSDSFSIELEEHCEGHIMYFQRNLNMLFSIYFCYYNHKLLLNTSIFSYRINNIKQATSIDFIGSRFCLPVGKPSEKFLLSVPLELRGKLHVDLMFKDNTLIFNVPWTLGKAKFLADCGLTTVRDIFISLPKVGCSAPTSHSSSRSEMDERHFSMVAPSNKIKCCWCENHLDKVYNCIHYKSFCEYCSMHKGCEKCHSKEDVFSHSKRIYYYCRYKCKLFFSGADLYSHEQQCKMNPCSALSNVQYVKSLFCLPENKKFNCTVGNKFFHTKRWWGVEERYMVNFEGQKCVIRCGPGVIGRYHFLVSHQYDPSMYYFLIRVSDSKNNTHWEGINSCVIEYDNISKYYRNAIYYVVILFRQIK